MIGCKAASSKNEAIQQNVDAYEKMAFERYIADKLGVSGSPDQYVFVERDSGPEKVISIFPRSYTEEDLQQAGGKKSGGYSAQVYVSKKSGKIVKMTIGA